MMRRASAAGAVLLLAGCAGPRPSIPQSAAVVAPTAWRVDGGAGAIQAIQNDWWESFGDPALNALVGEALRNNVDVMVAASRVAQVALLGRPTHLPKTKAATVVSPG